VHRLCTTFIIIVQPNHKRTLIFKYTDALVITELKAFSSVFFAHPIAHVFGSFKTQ